MKLKRQSMENTESKVLAFGEPFKPVHFLFGKRHKTRLVPVFISDAILGTAGVSAVVE